MRLLNLKMGTSLLACVSSLVLSACSPGQGAGDNDSTGVAEPLDPDAPDGEFLTDCTGEDCPGGTRAGVRTTCEASRKGARLLRRLTRAELQRTLDDVFPEVVGSWGGVQLSADPVSHLGFSTDAKVLVVNAPTFKDMLDTAEELAEAVTAPGTLETLLPCVSEADRSCAEEFVNLYGLRLFRRPLSETETTRYADYQQSVSERSDFATGTKWALSAMLQSPHAFYRSEIGSEEGGKHSLSQYEIATNLAYTYGGTTPTPELLAKAADGELSSPDALRAEAAHLLEDEQNWETARSFFREWLGYGRALNQTRVDEPEFAETYSELLVQETQIFLDQIMFRGGNVQQLLTADFTTLNGELAAYYGYGNSDATEFEAVQRPTGQGIGILGQGSMLVTTAHQTETSPTLRGLMFTENFLCVEPIAPPDVIPPLESAPGIEDAKTTREKYEIAHTSAPACANCHAGFDPFGFALEHFDETGRYRENEEGETIDASSAVELPDGSTHQVDGLESLARLVDETDDIENCVSGLMATYLLSGGGGVNCLAEESRRQLAAGEISLRQFMIDLAATHHFSSRAL